MTYFYILIAVLIGALTPIQGGINSQLSTILKHPLQASFISFTGGFLILLIIVLVLNKPFPGFGEMQKTPWYLFTGGAFGVAFVSAIIILIPRIGATNLIAAALVGQLVMSVIVDHYGLLKVPVHEISWIRIVGVLLLIGGVLLVQKT